MTGGSWSKSVTAITERPAGAFSGIIINISPNLGSISVHKSLDAIEISSIINNFTSDKLFIKVVMDLSFKPSKFFLAYLQDQNEWWFHLYLLLIFLWVQVKKLLLSQSHYNDKAKFLIWSSI